MDYPHFFQNEKPLADCEFFIIRDQECIYRIRALNELFLVEKNHNVLDEKGPKGFGTRHN